MRERVDILVIGGGINGVGIARDAAGRGLDVMLCEARDLAAATSSASSKMIHGGLRYLEHFAFRLVRESLAEREILLRAAPHLVRPRRFVLPHASGQRPRWTIRLGLFLYDRLGGRSSLPGSAALRLRHEVYGAPLREDLDRGFVYSDCCVDDVRLVVVNARDAARRGAEILTRTAVVAARRDGGEWRVSLQTESGEQREVTARILVNAAGPWVGETLRLAGLAGRARARLVKGSHIDVPRLYDGEHAYLLQNDDGRVVFVIPYEDDFTLVGTTELPFTGDPAAATASAEEIAYLCRAVSRYFRAELRPEAAVWSFAGVRPLYDDGSARASAISRDYVLEVDEAGAPALSVFGGKLTTYRRLAERTLARLAPHLGGAGPAWTASAILPGGEAWPGGGAAAALQRDYPFLNAKTTPRLVRAYGADSYRLLGEARAAADLGRDFGGGLTQREVDWLVAEEWARTAEDILWRRSKLGLKLPPSSAEALARYLRNRTNAAVAGASR